MVESDRGNLHAVYSVQMSYYPLTAVNDVVKLRINLKPRFTVNRTVNRFKELFG